MRDRETVSMLSRAARHLYCLGESDCDIRHVDRGLVRLLRDLDQAGFTGPRKRSLHKLANRIEESSDD